MASRVKNLVRAPVETDPLTLGMERFAHYFAIPPEDGKGRSMTDAYMLAYPGTKSRVQACTKAVELMKRANVKAKVAQLRKEYQDMVLEEVKLCSIASRAERVRRKNDHWLRIQQLLDERAKAAEKVQERIDEIKAELRSIEPDNPKRIDLQIALNDLLTKFTRIAGESTGMLARTVQGVGSGDTARIVDVAKFDQAPLNALLDLEKSAAEELGQVEHNPSIVINNTQQNAFVTALKDDELDSHIRAAERRKTA